MCQLDNESPRMQAVLSLGKLCDENEYSYEWINGQKNHISTKDGIQIPCNTENFVLIVVPGLLGSSFLHQLTSRTPSKQGSHSFSFSSPATERSRKPDFFSFHARGQHVT